MKFTPDNITELQEYEIFVFGSNESGIHGAGAAKLAFEKFGAVWGVGVGRRGKTYAIPTKDYTIKTLDLIEIEDYVKEFLIFANNNSNLTFLVTEIGCGLAGYTPKDIGPLFKGAPSNVILPQVFHNHIRSNSKMKFTPDNITELQENEIFVFGCSETGTHSSGAAKLAFEKFGAMWCFGAGHYGNSYAIPTNILSIKDGNKLMYLDVIYSYVKEFLIYAKKNPDLTFLVTQIGCGRSGYHPRDIAPMFRGASDNVILPEIFHNNM
jgi:hypothetical protein